MAAKEAIRLNYSSGQRSTSRASRRGGEEGEEAVRNICPRLLEHLWQVGAGDKGKRKRAKEGLSRLHKKRAIDFSTYERAKEMRVRASFLAMNLKMALIKA